MMNCPVCDTKNSSVEFGASDSTYDYCSCPRCGDFFLEKGAGFARNTDGGDLTREQAQISHYIRRHQSVSSLKFNQAEIDRILKYEALPDVAEQINLVIEYIGKKSEFFGQRHNDIAVKSAEIAAYGGFVNDKSIWSVLDALQEKGFILFETSQCKQLRLTLDGWQRYEEIDKGKTESKKAFMAMKFDDSLNEMYSKFQEAVSLTGFKLHKLDELAEAGLIDVRMYQRIKTCKFVIADLTHGNQGAYWEAGYAAGLGKKVIYTCQKSVFDADKTKENKVIHFDVNHHQMVLWDENNPGDAIEKLKAMIRVTFPDATQEDKKNEQTA